LQLSKWTYFGDWFWRLAAATLAGAVGVYALRLALPESFADSRGSAALSLVALGVLYTCVLLIGLRSLRFLQQRDLAILKRILPGRLQPLVSHGAVQFLFGARG
jgi:hypothetical protein